MKTLPDFDRQTALAPVVILDAILARRDDVTLDQEQRDWFCDFVDSFLRYQFRKNKRIRGRLKGKKGREVAYAFIEHWLDALVYLGFDRFRERHPLDILR